MAIDLRVRGKWEHIGGIGFAGIDRRNQSAEFGISIGEKNSSNPRPVGACFIDICLNLFKTFDSKRFPLIGCAKSASVV
jgi:hypothetical protein